MLYIKGLPVFVTTSTARIRCDWGETIFLGIPYIFLKMEIICCCAFRFPGPEVIRGQQANLGKSGSPPLAYTINNRYAYKYI